MQVSIFSDKSVIAIKTLYPSLFIEVDAKVEVKVVNVHILHHVG